MNVLGALKHALKHAVRHTYRLRYSHDVRADIYMLDDPMLRVSGTMSIKLHRRTQHCFQGCL